MNWTMPYPWRSRRDSVRRINMSSEPGNESFFCALRPIPRILSLRRRDYASQVQIGEPSRRMRIAMARLAAVDNRLATSISTGLKRQSVRASGGQPELNQLDEKSPYRSSGIGVYRSGMRVNHPTGRTTFQKGSFVQRVSKPKGSPKRSRFRADFPEPNDLWLAILRSTRAGTSE